MHKELIARANNDLSMLKRGDIHTGHVVRILADMIVGIEASQTRIASLEAQLAAKGEPVIVTKDMAYSFHHATSDGDLGESDIEDIMCGLRAVLCNIAEYSYPQAAPAQEIEPVRQLTDAECGEIAYHKGRGAYEVYQLKAGNRNFTLFGELPKSGQAYWIARAAAGEQSADAKDAARYRYITITEGLRISPPGSRALKSLEENNAYIDAAIKAGEQKGAQQG